MPSIHNKEYFVSPTIYKNSKLSFGNISISTNSILVLMPISMLYDNTAFQVYFHVHATLIVENHQ